MNNNNRTNRFKKTSRKKTMNDLKGIGWIYRFGLSRATINELYEIFDKDINLCSDDELKIKIFGSLPYSFLNPECISTAAPLKEFGRFGTPPGQLKCFLDNLPQEMRDVIFDYTTSRGIFHDKEGRYYKKEDPDTNTWSVLLPKKKVKDSYDEPLEYPEEDDVIELRLNDNLVDVLNRKKRKDPTKDKKIIYHFNIVEIIFLDKKISSALIILKKN